MLKPQWSFFNNLKKKVANNNTLAYELSELLNISIDAAYRRMRGTTSLNYNEILKLCRHYNISFDEINELHQKNVILEYQSFNKENPIENIKSYLLRFSNMTTKLIKMKNKEIIYAATDIPCFYIYKFHELALFKYYLWISTITNHTISYKDFEEECIKNNIISMLMSIANDYDRIPSSEIWNSHTTDSLLRQLSYHKHTHLLIDKKTINLLEKRANDLINYVQKIAESTYEQKNRKIYFIDLNIENHYALLKSDSVNAVFLKAFSVNSFMTTNSSFCLEIENWLKALIKKSTLITGASEKKMIQFINNEKQKIENILIP